MTRALVLGRRLRDGGRVAGEGGAAHVARFIGAGNGRPRCMKMSAQGLKYG
jgi:hypothetical protein